MKNTRKEILSLANTLIVSIGYNAFSYADISRQLNIKNAAIHYYFPNKSDLGCEVIRKSKDAFLEKTESWQELDYKQQYLNYITMHDHITKDYWACVVGALSISFDTLPEKMQQELQSLVHTIIYWLTEILSKGKEKKLFSFPEDASTKAYLVHAALMSSLLVNKILRNGAYKIIQEGLMNI